jgi:hypothetical protein
MSELPVIAPRCMYLQCKAMVVYGESFEDDPDYQAGLTNFWCVRSAKSLGPDDDEVNLGRCTDPTRPCYQAF